MIKPCLEMRFRDLTYLVFPIMVFALGEIILDVFGNPSLIIPQKPNEFAAIQEAANRYSFFAAELSFVLFSIGFLLYFVYDVANSFSRKSQWVILFGYALICSVMAIFIWRPSVFTLPERTYWLLGKTFFETSLGSVKPSFSNNLTMFDIYMLILKAMNVSAFLAVPALVMGCVSSLGLIGPVRSNADQLSRPDTHANPATEVTGMSIDFVLGYQAERLRTYLFLSSFLLVVVVVQLTLWMQWPSFSLRDDSRGMYDMLVRSISTYYGVNYTTLLCSYYIPPCIVLAKRIHEQARSSLQDKGEALTVKSIRQWEAKMGLAVIDMKSYKIIAALLSPLFPGVIGTLLNSFGGGK
nr:hypothetical protein [Methylobacterium sp. L1A1]